MLKRNNSKRDLLMQIKSNSSSDNSNERFLEVRKCFAKYDRDGEGSLSKDNIPKVLKDLGHDEQVIAEVVSFLKGEKMSFTDFVSTLHLIESKKFKRISEMLNTSQNFKVSKQTNNQSNQNNRTNKQFVKQKIS